MVDLPFLPSLHLLIFEVEIMHYFQDGQLVCKRQESDPRWFHL